MQIKKRLQDWLEIPKPDPKQEIPKELKDTISKLESELSFWKGWFRSRTAKKNCTKCKKEIELWPFNKSTAYYVRGNQVTHQQCSKGEKK